MITENKAKLALIGLLLLSVIFCFLIFYDAGSIKKIDMNHVLVTDDITYCIDSVQQSNGVLTIADWAAKQGESIESIDMQVVLCSEDTQTGYVLPTQMTNRQEVTDALNDGFNYNYSGFLSRGLLSKLKLSKRDFTIYLHYKNNGEDLWVKTQHSIKNGEVLQNAD